MPASKEDAVKQHCDVKLVWENAGEGWSQPEPLGTGAAFGERDWFGNTRHRWKVLVGFCSGALGGSAPTWVVGAFHRTNPLEPAWDWCLVPESHPGMFKWLPVGGWRRKRPHLAPALLYPSLLPTVFPLRWKKEVIYFWGAFAPDVQWWQLCLYHCTLCLRTGAPGLCLPASAAGDPVPSSCPAWPPLLAARRQEEGVSSPPPAAGSWISILQVGQERFPAAPSPPGNRCQSRGVRGACSGTPQYRGQHLSSTDPQCKGVNHNVAAVAGYNILRMCCCLGSMSLVCWPRHPSLSPLFLLTWVFLSIWIIQYDFGAQWSCDFFWSRQPAGNRRSLNKREALVTTSLLFTVPSSREVKRQWMKWRINHA